jgi:3'(2'), 5'-bisphosphate nucleotidase
MEKLMNGNSDYLLEVARRAARSGAEQIRDIYGQYLSGGSIDIRDKAVNDPVTAADMAANRTITHTLREAFPLHAILTEEDPDTWGETGHEWVWMIDPLDGTRDFIKANGEFVTMIGLAHNAEPTVGVVIEPVTGLELYASKGFGAYKSFLFDGEQSSKLTAPQEPDLNGLRIAVSRSHRDAKVDELIRLLDIKREISSGSVGRKMALVINGKADLYVHPSKGTKLWDTCACEVIASEGGLVFLSGAGEPIQYLRQTGDMENGYGLLVCSPAIADKVVWASRKVWGLK